MNNLRIKTILSLIVLTFIISSCGSEKTFSFQEPFQPLVQYQEITAQSAQQVLENKAPKEEVINAVFKGTVVELLPDDTSGLKHQKFMYKISAGLNGKYNGEVVLVAHNLDVAPYVPLKVGTQPEIKGDFLPEESPKILHWTHLDLTNKHPDGYIKVVDKIYQ